MPPPNKLIERRERAMIIMILILMVGLGILSLAQYTYKLEYQMIYDYRTRLVDTVLYNLKQEEINLINSGSAYDLHLWRVKHPQYKDYTGLPRKVDNFFTKMDITLPDDGPFDEDEADDVLKIHFGHRHKTLALANKVIGDYRRANHLPIKS